MATQRGRTSGSGGHRSRRSAGARAAPPMVGGPRADLAALRERLVEMVEPAVSAAGYELDGLAVSRAGRRHLVRITVDGDRGVDSGAIAALAQRISAALDAAEAGGDEVVPGQYTLEVSSPGVDRPLTQPRHWRRNVGRLVKVKVGDRLVTGRVVAADDEGVSLEVAGTVRRAGHPELGPGRVEIEFNRRDTDGTDATDGGDVDDLPDDDDLDDEDGKGVDEE